MERDRDEIRTCKACLWRVAFALAQPGSWCDDDFPQSRSVFVLGLVLGPNLLRALDNSLWHAVAFLAGFYVFSIGGLQVIALILGTFGQLSPHGRLFLQYGSMVLMILVAGLLFTNGLQA